MASEHVKRMGARIKDRREELGLTQKQLADLVGGATDGNQVSKWERGQNRPTDARLEKIAEALQVEPSYFHMPPPVEGPGDLMGGFSPGDDRPGQLDRMEAMLREIMEHLGVAVVTPSAVADVVEEEAARHIARRARSGTSPRTSRRSTAG